VIEKEREMRGLIWDILLIAGASLVVAGLAFIYWPAAMIVAGILLVALGVYGTWLEARPPAAPAEGAEREADEPAKAASSWDS
jgi:hypothetical protein